jgi:ribulose-phosphate 3-epimerase
MDGHFVNNITIGPAVVQSIRKKCNLIFDVHLMIDNPEKFISEFAKAGADIITFHITATKDPLELIKNIRLLGCKVGVAINPDESLDLIVNYLPLIDQVIIMGVYAGFGGQKFIPDTLLNIKKLRDLGYEKDIEIDGGINQETIIDCNRAGANIFVSGSFVFKSQNPKEAIELLRKSIQ